MSKLTLNQQCYKKSERHSLYIACYANLFYHCYKILSSIPVNIIISMSRFTGFFLLSRFLSHEEFFSRDGLVFHAVCAPYTPSAPPAAVILIITIELAPSFIPSFIAISTVYFFFMPWSSCHMPYTHDIFLLAFLHYHCSVGFSFCCSDTRKRKQFKAF